MSNKVNPTTGVSDAELNGHTEQALVELIYVQEANNLIGSAMGNLDSALNASQSVLNILQALQNLHNEISVHANSSLPFNFSTGTSPIGPYTGTSGLTPTQYVSSYNAVASAYFGKPIDPYFVFSSASDPGFKTFASSLLSLKNSLISEIKVISAITPAADKGAGSLYASLTAVLKDLPTNPLNYKSAETWALDNYNQSSGIGVAAGQQALAGNFQNDLTTAITAAQSLNDTQKENVRKFLFIFQEYYQSATAILSGINQIIEQIAQKISS